LLLVSQWGCGQLAWSEGPLTAAKKEDGLLKAAANPRGMQGYAVGR
jgi:gamma-glutamyltranspeptidase/glutathione hydrolase